MQFLFIYTVGTPFMCETMMNYLRENTSSLSNIISYEKMKHNLLANEIITSDQKWLIQNLTESNKVKNVLSIIDESLVKKQTGKLKRFLKIMEESGDQVLEKIAEMLG